MCWDPQVRQIVPVGPVIILLPLGSPHRGSSWGPATLWCLPARTGKARVVPLGSPHRGSSWGPATLWCLPARTGKARVVPLTFANRHGRTYNSPSCICPC